MASKTTKDHKWTEEENTFLRNHISQLKYSELADAFNERFGTNLKHGHISDHCIKQLKIKRNCPQRFNTGSKDFNAYKIGTEVWDGYYVWVKVANEYSPGTAPGKQLSPNWQKKKEIVYAKTYGKVPDGYLIIHLDKDRQNCEPDNLYAVSRKVNFMMGKNNWYTQSKEHTLTAIKLCELFYAMQNKKERKRK